MAFPKTLEEMKSFGYRFEGHGNCSSCGAEIEWWTTPHGKKLPVNLMDKPSDLVKPHWAISCNESRLF
ncbi:MAG TPA: hypothetical protein VKX41_15075 [Alloacidobacterium sp.]|jgi:hypothetical protein|nr:hypothetical protein [Alloacidobacterium sp.]